MPGNQYGSLAVRQWSKQLTAHMPSKGQAGVAESSSRLGTLHRQHKPAEACKVAKNRQSYITYITQNTKHLRLDKISKEQTWRQKGQRKPESNPSSAVQTCGHLQSTLSPSDCLCRCGCSVCSRRSCQTWTGWSLGLSLQIPGITALYQGI